MKRVKITPKQYNLILLREQETRLKDNTTQVNESLSSDGYLIQEGLKEVLLGVASLLDVKLNGLNQTLAQKALKNDSTMSEIKATLEDENKTKELAKSFTDKGMKDPDTLMAKNAKKLVDNFNKLSHKNGLTYQLNDLAISNIESLSKELVKEKEKAKSEAEKKAQKTKSITVKDVIKTKLSTDNTFTGGNFTLNSFGINAITSIFDSIKSVGGEIVSVKIESSTDANLSVKHKSQEDPTGNIKLATLRTKSVADLIDNINDKIHITHREIPNNGSDVVGHRQFLEALEDEESLNKLKRKTVKFRYLELTITFEVNQKVQEDTLPEEFIKDYRLKFKNEFDVERVALETGSGIIYPNKKVKCNISDKKVGCMTV